MESTIVLSNSYKILISIFDDIYVNTKYMIIPFLVFFFFFDVDNLGSHFIYDHEFHAVHR